MDTQRACEDQIYFFSIFRYGDNIKNINFFNTLHLPFSLIFIAAIWSENSDFGQNSDQKN